MSDESQKRAFLLGEGDAWYSRNGVDETDRLDHIDRVIIDLVGSPASVLEIGCADGRRLRRIGSAIDANVRLVGIDPSASAVADGRASGSNLDLIVGTADALPHDEDFDLVVIGFCLYLCDRALLSRVVSEVDRVLVDGGQLIIVDFDPPTPRRRRYRHLDGVWSFKMDYSSLFTAFPHFVLSDKRSMSHSRDSFEVDETERIAVWSLRKQLSSGYPEEKDV